MRLFVGSRQAIVDLAQQLAWIGATFRSSEKVAKLEYSNVLTRCRTTNDGTKCLTIKFGHETIPSHPSYCWYPLFNDFVIAQGFPALERPKQESGLEIPLDLMAALGGARHITEFEGGLVMKGPSTLFIPTIQNKDLVVWHLIENSSRARIKYEVVRQYQNRVLLHELNHSKLQSKRTILGWWEVKETILGAQNTPYADLEWSEAKKTGRSFKVSQVALGFSKPFTAQVNFSSDGADNMLRYPCSGSFKTILRWAEEQTVVLYDYPKQRSWLVTALDVIMHVVRTRVHKRFYQKTGDQKVLPSALSGKHGRDLQEILMRNAPQTSLDDISIDQGGLTLKDAILDIWSLIERLAAKEEIKEATSGLEMRGTIKRPLYGWEYMDLVDGRNFRQKRQLIAIQHGGWINLVQDVGSIILYGNGFGDVIKPISEANGLCQKWRSLPAGKDYLAVECSTLETLYQEAGSRESRSFLTSTRLKWHHCGLLFGPCSSPGLPHCSCDRLQRLRVGSIHSKVKVPPRELPVNGCVIFGHSSTILKMVARLNQYEKQGLQHVAHISLKGKDLEPPSLVAEDRDLFPKGDLGADNSSNNDVGHVVAHHRQYPVTLNGEAAANSHRHSTTRRKGRLIGTIQSLIQSSSTRQP